MQGKDRCPKPKAPKEWNGSRAAGELEGTSKETRNGDQEGDLANFPHSLFALSSLGHFMCEVREWLNFRVQYNQGSSSYQSDSSRRSLQYQAPYIILREPCARCVWSPARVGTNM